MNDNTVYTKNNGFPQYVSFFNEELVEKIIFQDRATIVFLSNGAKGVSKCSVDDEYDECVGFIIAYCRAMEIDYEAIITKLKGVI